MLSLHHTHLFAADVDRSIAFWRDHFGAVVLVDTVFAGARNVFLRVGEGRLHLYDQAPRHAGAGTVHHLGIETDEHHLYAGVMPDDKVAVVRDLRAAAQAAGIAPPPTVVLLDRAVDSFLARRAGASAWIRKPFNGFALRRLVDRLAAERRAAAG